MNAVMIFKRIDVNFLVFRIGNQATNGFGVFRLNGFAIKERFKNVSEIVRSSDPPAFTEVGVRVVNAALVERFTILIA